ncbi:protein of unknown function [Taphrina deformans PYCC 5710]|uniref:Sucrose transport protein n=1 Tax=Taphrina deformans (strain PYCC 5710 / ATCC 11124 / CBS 356.35 / IMI 108563 / JCM 9778 / NBRC 8474) TaxID=1097556 RepID=R4XD35_TAPDE|nr:protein of unknown function [Taphrina deformans PYCC 5710]|eukprot:CCG83791.1 protein of unknown function [Taphrina deformans PYCC 5710]
MILLTTSLFGLQFVWGTEQVYFMNYMVSIGLSKTWISLIWLAGPLSGLIVQPIVGAYSDSCQSSYGRRRPFLVLGCIITVICLFTVGWAHDISHALLPAALAQATTIMAVVASVFLLDFAVNTVQAVGRAIIVDSLPQDQQESGNAWASRLVAIGHLLAYFMGFLDLRGPLAFLGDTQFKIVIVLSNLALLCSVMITCRSVEERVLIDRGTEKEQSLATVLKSIWQTFKSLPKRIRCICLVQVLVWHGWFPFLFYSSTWIGEVYAREHSNEMIDADTRSRQGALAMTIFSCVTLTCTLLVPKYLAKDPKRSDESRHRLSLPHIWALSHFLFGLAMISAAFITSSVLAIMNIATCGFAWAVMSWVPFTLIGEEISKSATKSRRNSNIIVRTGASQVLLTTPDYYDDELEVEGLDENNYAALQRSLPASNDDAGSILGIHNIAICVPQFIISFISSIVFRLLEPKPVTDGNVSVQDGPNAIGVVLAIGGVFAIAGGVLTLRKL